MFQYFYERILRVILTAFALCAGLGILGMMAVTCADVAMRAFTHPIKGSYDIAQILSVLALAGALPYTTALKGHVAVEYFFDKLPAIGRMIVDSLMRLLMIALFALFAWHSIEYGIKLKMSGEIMATLHIPVFWMPWLIAASCCASGLVVLFHLVFPGKALLRS